VYHLAGDLEAENTGDFAWIFVIVLGSPTLSSIKAETHMQIFEIGKNER
jgi:hypothetical protein